jgi:YD repeat-containing protein
MEGTTLITYYNADGLIGKTIDTTDGASSTTTYTYDDLKRLITLVNNSASTGQAVEKEEHIWKYNASGHPLSMLKIRNGIDTTYLSFVLDEKGNVIEEKSIRKGKEQLPYYYYYDDQNRLTDIVHYNPIAKRLLPDYIFEYDASGKIRSMLVVPPGGTDYQRWMYTYDDRGLKIKETVYNKNRQAMGMVEYKYQ